MSDISSVANLKNLATSAYYNGTRTEKNSELNLDDFLTLIVAQFQNQDPNSPADTKEMMNYMVQMSVIEAISNITDATTTMYAGSLVGKEVTVGQYNSQGQLEEIVGTVTGTGTYGGQQVIFVDGVSYYLSEIMAIGRLPETSEAADGAEKDPPESGSEDDSTEPSTETEDV
ncbi:MAG: hypothetical protein IJF15_02375 [Oscillospiraceae bacterium]|nr:hypothetical protein [Oscillospiraceae bacterium]